MKRLIPLLAALAGSVAVAQPAKAAFFSSAIIEGPDLVLTAETEEGPIELAVPVDVARKIAIARPALALHIRELLAAGETVEAEFGVTAAETVPVVAAAEVETETAAAPEPLTIVGSALALGLGVAGKRRFGK